MRPRAVVLLLLGAAGLAGCMAPVDGECPPAPGYATPIVDGIYMQTDPGQAWQTLVLDLAPVAGRSADLSMSASSGWSATEAAASPADPGLRVVTVAPREGGPGNATLGYVARTDDGDCRTTDRGSVTWDLAAPKAGRAAATGQGVHVMTAGFFENGTLFYTNIAEIDTDPRWPHVSWYAWEGDMALPVYVYDEDRTEQPAYWLPLSDSVPKTGTPADPLLAEAAWTVDAEVGLGYYTTIPGFNQALQGLSTTTTRVVRLAPEEAYTRPGNEEHPLYGAPIVFYIKVLDVVSLPCPAMVKAPVCAIDPPLVIE